VDDGNPVEPPQRSRSIGLLAVREARGTAIRGALRMPSRRWPFMLVAMVAMTLMSGRPAAAGAPTDAVMSNIDRVISVLEDPGLKSQPRERRAAVRRIAREIFDVRETARRSLGRHWQARTPAEREEFVQLFGDLLEATYLSKIEGYGGEKVLNGGDTVDGQRAIVHTRLMTRKGTEIGIDYRLLRQSDSWKVYDVSIEGVSLVANYRVQFDRIIQGSSYEDLVQKLRNKHSEFTTGAKPPS
jgi:phospholipid transport system substrate-binding protein